MTAKQIEKAADLFDDIEMDARHAGELLLETGRTPVDMPKLKEYNQSIISTAAELQKLINSILGVRQV